MLGRGKRGYIQYEESFFLEWDSALYKSFVKLEDRLNLRRTHIKHFDNVGDLQKILHYSIERQMEPDEKGAYFNFKFRKVRSGGNIVCLWGSYIDLDTGNVLISSDKKEEYFSFFNFFDLLKIYDIEVTPGTLKHCIEQYKLQEITLLEFIDALHEGDTRDIKQNSLLKNYLIEDLQEVSVDESVVMGIVGVFNVVTHGTFMIFYDYDADKHMDRNYLNEKLPRNISDTGKSFFADFASHAKDLSEATVSLEGTTYLKITTGYFRGSLIEDSEITQILYNLSSGLHFEMHDSSYRDSQVLLEEGPLVAMAANLEDIIETSDEYSYLIDYLRENIISIEKLIERVGLANYVGSNKASIFGQGFEETVYKVMKEAGLPVEMGVFSPEDATLASQLPHLTDAFKDTTVMYRSTLRVFRKLQRALRRMEQSI